MKKTISILCFAFLIFGCKDNSVLSYSEKVFVKKSDLGCSEFCPVAKLEVTHFENTKVADSINNKVFLFFKEILSFEDKPYEASDYDTLLSSFIGSYEQLKTKFPEDTIGWEVKGKSEISYQNKKIINIKIEYYLFTGGAHGYFGMKSLFFDIQTGKELTQEDLLTDNKEFTLFAEKKFREKFQINENRHINSKGFMFENDVFHLPNNIFFTETGILLVYNSYEIASYADGIQDVFIPFEEVKPFFNSVF